MPLIGRRIEISNDNFVNMVRKDCLLVDKTRFLKDWLEGQDISLITRQRRSGKTLIMTMCQAFFAESVSGRPTAGLFDRLAIAQEDDGEFLRLHQGKYPVIFISLKDIRENSHKENIKKIRKLITRLYQEHEGLLNSEAVSASEKTMFQEYLDSTVNDAGLEDALKFLSQFLYKAHGHKNVMIFIDEYDAPLANAYHHGFIEPLSDFMRNFFSAALKTNPYLEKGLMTGILRVSKSNMLSELNNLEVYTLLDNCYSQYFGFTETEVEELLERVDTGNITLGDVSAYYNGYKIDDTVIYSPWSVMKFLSRRALGPYWVLTSNDTLIKEILLTSDAEIKQKFTTLMQGQSVQGEIDINLRYEDLMEKPHTLWTLLTFCGYLTVESKAPKGSRFLCQLRIPNQEVLNQYTEIFADWLKEKMGETQYHSLLQSLVAGQVEAFTEILGQYLMDSLSFRDVGGDKKSERFYHGFVAGLVAGIRDTHWVDSNKESGRGLYDVILIPKDTRYAKSILLEFKHVKSNTNLDAAAQSALAQINTQRYTEVLNRFPHVQTVIKVGMVFCEKSVSSVYQEENLQTQQSSPPSAVLNISSDDDEDIEAHEPSASAASPATSSAIRKRKASTLETTEPAISEQQASHAGLFSRRTSARLQKKSTAHDAASAAFAKK